MTIADLANLTIEVDPSTEPVDDPIQDHAAAVLAQLAHGVAEIDCGPILPDCTRDVRFKVTAGAAVEITATLAGVPPAYLMRNDAGAYMGLALEIGERLGLPVGRVTLAYEA